MALPLLGEIEKLINEHGSAAILKERIELLKEQYAALEKRLADADQQRNEALTVNLSLKARVAELESLIKPAGPAKTTDRIDPIREQLLQELAQTSEYLSSDHLANACGISIQLALYHLEDLEESDYVHGSYSALGDPPEWKLIQFGRSYLVAHGLLT